MPTPNPLHPRLWKALSDAFVIYPEDAIALQLATAATHRVPYGAAEPFCTVYLVTFARSASLGLEAARRHLQRLEELSLAAIDGEEDNLVIDFNPLLEKAAELSALATQRRGRVSR